MRKMLIALLVSVFATPAGGFAQTRPVIEGPDGTSPIPALRLPAGIMRAVVSREYVRLPERPPPLHQQRPRTRSWPGRHPVLFGALAGLGTGLAVEAVVIPGASGGEPHSAYLPMFGSLGAGIGSLVGVIVSAARR